MSKYWWRKSPLPQTCVKYCGRKKCLKIVSSFHHKSRPPNPAVWLSTRIITPEMFISKKSTHFFFNSQFSLLLGLSGVSNKVCWSPVEMLGPLGSKLISASGSCPKISICEPVHHLKSYNFIFIRGEPLLRWFTDLVKRTVIFVLEVLPFQPNIWWNEKLLTLWSLVGPTPHPLSPPIFMQKVRSEWKP